MYVGSVCVYCFPFMINETLQTCTVTGCFHQKCKEYTSKLPPTAPFTRLAHYRIITAQDSKNYLTNGFLPLLFAPFELGMISSPRKLSISEQGLMLFIRNHVTCVFSLVCWPRNDNQTDTLVQSYWRDKQQSEQLQQQLKSAYCSCTLSSSCHTFYP